MRQSGSEKLETIRLVEDSELSVEVTRQMMVATPHTTSWK